MENNSRKGGYKIVSLNGLDLAGENLYLKGLYSALKNSYGKVIMLAGIIIDGVKKKDAYVQADEDNDNIVIKHVYGYNLSVDEEDAITVTEDSENISLPVPAPEDDGMFLGVNVLGKYVLKNLGDSLPYVRKMDAPTSTTLTDEQINEIKGGVFINGNFLGYKNPVFFPANTSSFGDTGLIIGKPESGGVDVEFCIYLIDSNKTINKRSVISKVSYNYFYIYDKVFPQYPTNTGTYVLKVVNGSLSWVEEQA